MKILHVITSLRTGGAERLMVDLLPLLCDGGNNVVELALFDGTVTPFYKELSSKGVRIHNLTAGGNVYNPLNIARMIRFMGKYDLIHTHNTACQLYVAMAKAISFVKTKLVTTEHNSTNRRRTKKWFRPIDRWMYNQYSAVVCIADQTRDNLIDYIGPVKELHTIYNGVNISRFKHPIKDIEGNTHFTISMLAAFRDQKDHETLLRAMCHLPEAYHLQLVGGGSDKRISELKELCRSLKIDQRVAFLGVRTDVPDILEQSDIVVLSSHWEGLSLSSIEGMASGRPFIASDVDGLREFVKGAGILFPHGDDRVLARHIQDLCEHPDLYRKVAAQCQEKAAQFDISVMAQKYLDLYKSL